MAPARVSLLAPVAADGSFLLVPQSHLVSREQTLAATGPRRLHSSAQGLRSSNVSIMPTRPENSTYRSRKQARSALRALPPSFQLMRKTCLPPEVTVKSCFSSIAATAALMLGIARINVP